MTIIFESYETMIPLGITEFLMGTTVFLVSWYFIAAYSKKKEILPPGPISLPIVGYLPFLGKDPHVKLRDMAFKYGDVFSFYLGGKLVVVLNGADAIREGMNKPEFLGRPPQSAFSFRPEIPNVGTVNGKNFHEQRRFILRSMRDLGFGKTVLEECMKDEIEYFLSFLDNWNGQPHEIVTVLIPSISNNIVSFIYGTRYDYEDPRRKLFDSNRKIVTQFFGQTAIHIFFPWIKHLPFFNKFFGYDRAVKAFDDILQYHRQQVEEHKKSWDPRHTSDYVDKFLLKMHEIKEKNIADTSFTENMLIGNSGALMGAGSDTAQTTLDWCFYIMAVYQNVQRKVQQEIDSVFGLERMPSYSEHKHMPYTQAVIMEVLRWRPILPLNVLRYALEDTTFRGYHIPRRTIVLANLWSAHYDHRYWDEPEVFRPERFLSPDGQVIKPEGYMPFSVGRRSCPGEPMAVVEVFIYITTILQRFDIKFPEGDVPDLEGITTFFYKAKPHKLSFIRRSSA